MICFIKEKIGNLDLAHICGDIMTESKLEKDLNEFFRERNLQFNSISTNTFYQGVVYQIYAVKRLYKDTQLEIPFDYKD